jgi:hypothetical protein
VLPAHILNISQSYVRKDFINAKIELVMRIFIGYPFGITNEYDIE